MQNATPDVFVSWSGGKDCAQSCWLAMQRVMRVRYLLNMVTPDGERAWTHGQSAKIIALQAEAMGIPILQVPTSLDEYDRRFREAVISLAEKGLTGGVFGTIDVPEHREWSRAICAGTGITPYLPLWGKPQPDILKNFIDSGFKAVIVATDASRMGEEWPGVEIDSAFFDKITRMPGITPCGEDGEYHSYVYDGPIFKNRVEILKSRKTVRNGHCYLEIQDARLAEK